MILRPFLPLAVASALALVSCGPGAAPQPPLSEAPLAGAAIGGPFALIDRHGKTVRWADFAGHYRIVYFGYTYCPDVCPTDVQRTIQGLALFGKDHRALAANIQPIFISIDPERDTPAVVGEFASAFSDRLIGLTGTPEQIRQTAKEFAVFYQRGVTGAGGGYMMDHSSATYLFDPAGKPLAILPTDQGPEAVAEELARWVR